MSAIIAAFVDHPRMVITVMCLVLIALVEVAVYRAGGNATASRMKAIEVAAMLKSDSALGEAQAALVKVKDQNDSLRTYAASMVGVVATKRTAAALVTSRMELHGDTARVSTDTGVVAIPIPHDLTEQLTEMETVNDSLVAALDKQHEADAALIYGQARQISVDSTIQVQYRKQLAAAEARVAAAEAKPRHSAAVAFLGGVVTTLIGGIVVAVVF